MCDARIQDSVCCVDVDRVRRRVVGVGPGHGPGSATRPAAGAAARLPRPARPVHRRPPRRRVLDAAHRDEPRGQRPVRLPAVRTVGPRRQLRARGCRSPRRRTDQQEAAGLSLRRHRPLQGDRGRVLHAQRSSRPEARRLRRLDDREDRRRAGEGRLPLHHADHRPAAPAPLGRREPLGTREGRQPRALQPRPSVRGRRRALPGHRQADAARRRPAHRRPAHHHVRPGEEVDLAGASDHRDGPRQAVSRDRQPAVSRPGEVHARRARPGRRQGRGTPLQPVADEDRRADRGGRPRGPRHLHVLRHGRRRGADRATPRT